MSTSVFTADASARGTRSGGSSRGRRAVALLAVWPLAFGCLAWALVRVSGLDRAGGVLVLLVPFTPYVAAGSVAVVAAALALRRWRGAVVAGIAAVTLLVCVLPRCIPDPGAPGDGPRLRVLSANLRLGGADQKKIIDLVRAEHVDLLAVQEFTADALDRLDAAGLAELLPYRVAYPHSGVEGSGLFSRYPLRDDGLRVHPSGMTQARATVTVGGRRLAVESVHPCAPWSPAMAACWRRDLAGEPAAGPGAEPRLLLGDFNATLDHAGLRHLVATGYRDAASVRGAGFSPTWPFDGRPVAPVALDHVLADRRIGVTRYAAYRVPGTDHRAVLAELTLP